MTNILKNRPNRVIDEPAIAKFLFNNPKASVLWLVVRVWLGWQWLDAGLHKFGEEAWTGTGAALQGYWTRAVAIPEAGRPAIAFDWYRDFIQFLLDTESYTWFAKLVVYGEILVGIALIVGAFVGVAAFFGAAMNWNFMMAGSASTNPVLFIAAVGLILAWKIAGYIGFDYYLLPLLGTPWNRDRVDNTDAQLRPARAAAGD